MPRQAGKGTHFPDTCNEERYHPTEHTKQKKLCVERVCRRGAKSISILVLTIPRVLSGRVFHSIADINKVSQEFDVCWNCAKMC